MLWFPLGFENFEDTWWQLCNIANLLGICPQTSWNTNNPWLCILHPTPAASASSSAYQGLARWKMKELIPKWCQEIQRDSIAVTFEPIHPICLEKKGQHQGFTNKSGILQILWLWRSWKQKLGEHKQTSSNLYNKYIYICIAGIGYWLKNEYLLVMELNSTQLLTVIWFTIQAVS